MFTNLQKGQLFNFFHGRGVKGQEYFYRLFGIQSIMWFGLEPGGGAAAEAKRESIFSDSASSTVGGASGPLQAFGQVHRAIRENEKKIASFSGELRQQDERFHDASRRLNESNRKHRAETSQMLADLEELVLQSYEEHETKLAAEKEASAKLRTELEAEQAAHRAALVAQQGQIDALAAALRRQQELLDEHMNGSSMQMSAVQAEAGELHRAFKAQGAAVQATKAFISSVDEKLSTMIEDRARASDAQLASVAAAFQAALGDHQHQIERVLGWESGLRASDENLKGWRAAVDEALAMLRLEASKSAENGAETVQSAEARLQGKLDATLSEVGSLRDRLTELQAETTATSSLKASGAEMEERCGALEAALTSHARLLTPLGPEMQAATSRLDQLEANVGEVLSSGSRHRREVADVSQMLSEMSTQLTEAKSGWRSQKQLLMQLQQAQAHGFSSAADVEAKVRQVSAMADEQSRWLATLADVLHQSNIRVPKFRSSALALQPSFDMQSSAPPPPLPDHLLLSVTSAGGGGSGGGGGGISGGGGGGGGVGGIGGGGIDALSSRGGASGDGEVPCSSRHATAATHRPSPAPGPSGLALSPGALPARTAAVERRTTAAEEVAPDAPDAPANPGPLLESLTPSQAALVRNAMDDEGVPATSEPEGEVLGKGTGEGPLVDESSPE